MDLRPEKKRPIRSKVGVVAGVIKMWCVNITVVGEIEVVRDSFSAIQ